VRPLTISVCTDEAAWAWLNNHWARLYDGDGAAAPGLSPVWLRACAAGLPDDRQMMIAAAYDDNGRLCAAVASDRDRLSGIIGGLGGVPVDAAVVGGDAVSRAALLAGIAPDGGSACWSVVAEQSLGSKISSAGVFRCTADVGEQFGRLALLANVEVLLNLRRCAGWDDDTPGRVAACRSAVRALGPAGACVGTLSVDGRVVAAQLVLTRGRMAQMVLSGSRDHWSAELWAAFACHLAQAGYTHIVAGGTEAGVAVPGSASRALVS
jgi:hypothetical protein